jgi:hypothetical protein
MQLTVLGEASLSKVKYKKDERHVDDFDYYFHLEANSDSKVIGVTNMKIFLIDVPYRITGLIRSDDKIVPEIYHGGKAFWRGTKTKLWQSVDFTFVATTTEITLYSKNVLKGNYIDFNNIRYDDLRGNLQLFEFYNEEKDG